MRVGRILQNIDRFFVRERSKQSRDDLVVIPGNRFDQPVLARCFLIDNLKVVLHHDSGAIAHFERDLPRVLRLLQAVRAEAAPVW